MKISVKPNRKKQIYCYFFTLPPNTPFHILNKNAECFTAETMDNIMVSMWYIAIKCKGDKTKRIKVERGENWGRR